jgi:hypothetical protein
LRRIISAATSASALVISPFLAYDQAMTRPALILVAALALTGCAAPNVDHSAIHFNESQFSIDLNLCRGGNIAEASLKAIGKGVVGSLAGAGFTAVNGAAAANSGEAIVVGAAVGAVLGLGIGASDAIEEHDQEISDCLREKGYEVVADVTISQAIEEIASDVGKAVKSGYEVTAEAVIGGYEYTTGQIEALINKLER